MAYSGKIHAQFELREKMQDDTTLFLYCSQVLFLSWKSVFLLLFRINVFLLLKYTLTLINAIVNNQIFVGKQIIHMIRFSKGVSQYRIKTEYINVIFNVASKFSNPMMY